MGNDLLRRRRVRGSELVRLGDVLGDVIAELQVRQDISRGVEVEGHSSSRPFCRRSSIHRFSADSGTRRKRPSFTPPHSRATS